MQTPPKVPSAARIVVVGTLNVDFIWQVRDLPRPGHTVMAHGAQREFGGKGANQAVAAARHGAQVVMIGTVGDDAEGRRYLDHLRAEGIDTRCLSPIQGAQTGSAQVVVNAAAENLIVVHGGANHLLTAEAVTRALTGLCPASELLVTQLEGPLNATLAALRFAADNGVRSVFNPSPVNPLFPWGEQPIDVVIVNEHECLACFGYDPAALIRQPPGSRRALLAAKGVHHLIVTQGSEPTLHFSAGDVESVPTFPVKPRDTVGAGDTFAGVLATQLAEGAGWSDAIHFANIAAALSTLAPGAQTAMPLRAAVAATPDQPA